MNKILVFLALSPAFAFASERQVTVTASQPACYELTNTAILGAIKNANLKAEEKCSDPELLSLKTKITEPSPCSYALVKAIYRCND